MQLVWEMHFICTVLKIDGLVDRRAAGAALLKIVGVSAQEGFVGIFAKGG